jgi:hypothetical protein
MVFDKNQIEFKDCIQEKVWELATRQVPLEITLPYVPDECKSACVDYYNFCQNLFAVMYENPELFGFEIDPSQPDWINKKQVEFYFWLIGHFGKYLTGNRCEMSAVAYQKIIKKFNPKSVEALESFGFVFEKNIMTAVISNHFYPGMFIAANEICGAGYANYKVNCDYFMMYCDYRGFAKYKRTYEDLHVIFSDKRRQIAEKLHNYCIANKIMPQKCNYFFRVDYKYKSKVVYIINVKDKNKYVINIGFAEIGSKAFKRIEEEIEKYDDAVEFKNYIINNFAKCLNCRQECWNKTNRREAFGKNIISCGTNIRILDPGENDLKYIFRLFDLRTLVIKEGIDDPYYPGSG